jgi:hypothetical protein
MIATANVGPSGQIDYAAWVKVRWTLICMSLIYGYFTDSHCIKALITK